MDGDVEVATELGADGEEVLVVGDDRVMSSVGEGGEFAVVGIFYLVEELGFGFAREFVWRGEERGKFFPRKGWNFLDDEAGFFEGSLVPGEVKGFGFG